MGTTPDQELEAAGGIGLIAISDGEFDALRGLVYDRFGINLTAEKRTLLVGRLQRVLRRRGYATFREYYESLLKDRNGEALAELAARISTNHTFFWREKDHFEFFLETVLPQTVARARQAGSRDVRVWCAGCSSGEEAYTLVMLMLEYFKDSYREWQAGILATDISPQALSLARAGVYTEERLELLPPRFKQQYFVRTPSGEYSVSEQVRREVTFRSFYLMNRQFPFRKPFDVIFCRNVMIYFDRPTRDALVQRFYDCTVPGGYFFIGHSETLGRGEDTPYTHLMPAVYRKGS